MFLCFRDGEDEGLAWSLICSSVFAKGKRARRGGMCEPEHVFLCGTGRAARGGKEIGGGKRSLEMSVCLVCSLCVGRWDGEETTRDGEVWNLLCVSVC